MTEKLESLEQAAREIANQLFARFIVRGSMRLPRTIGQEEEFVSLIGKGLAERERQVWAEAAKVIETFIFAAPENGSESFSNRITGLLAEALRARGEQVK